MQCEKRKKEPFSVFLTAFGKKRLTHNIQLHNCLDSPTEPPMILVRF